MSGKPYITDTGTDLVVVTAGPSGVHGTVQTKSVDEIRELLRQRQEIGQKITDAIKRSGINAASNEATEVVKP